MKIKVREKLKQSGTIIPKFEVSANADDYDMIQ